MKKIEQTLEEKTRRAEASRDGACLPTSSLASKRAERRAAKKRQQQEESSWCDPDDIPVVVIDGYMSREKGPHAKELWTFLAEWAAVLVENHVAHVIFITNNVAASKPLAKGKEGSMGSSLGRWFHFVRGGIGTNSQNFLFISFVLIFVALPSMTFETVVLADATLDSALEFVYKHLDRDEYPDLIRCVQTIGGRLTDLELFVQKVKSGMGPEGKLEKQMTVGCV